MPNTTPRRSTHKRRDDPCRQGFPTAAPVPLASAATLGDAQLGAFVFAAADGGAIFTECPNCHWLCSRSFFGVADHPPQHREQLLLRRRDDRVRDLGLLPEDPPVRLLRPRRAVHLGLARRAVPARRDIRRARIDAAHPLREDRVRPLQRGHLRTAEEQRVRLRAAAPCARSRCSAGRRRRSNRPTDAASPFASSPARPPGEAAAASSRSTAGARSRSTIRNGSRYSVRLGRVSANRGFTS